MSSLSLELDGIFCKEAFPSELFGTEVIAVASRVVFG